MHELKKRKVQGIQEAAKALEILDNQEDKHHKVRVYGLGFRV